MSKIVNLGADTLIIKKAAVTKTINIPAVTVTTSSIIVNRVIDDGTQVVAEIQFTPDDKELKSIVLWSGQDYVNVGQWTDTNVASKIISIYNPPTSH